MQLSIKTALKNCCLYIVSNKKLIVALVPIANAFIKNLRRYPNLHDKQYAEDRFGPMGPLVLPYVSSEF